MNALAHLTALLCLALLAGCQVTTLENLPTGATAQCPTEWRGGYIGHDDDEDTDAAFGIFVDEKCAMQVFDRSDKSDAPPVSIKPSYFSMRGVDVILIPTADAEKLVAPTDRRSPAFEKAGFIPLKWTRDDDGIMELQFPDHRRIATLIVNGGLDGETHWTSRDAGTNFLRGPAPVQQELLIDGDLFANDGDTRLRHVGTKRSDFDKALAKAAAASDDDEHRHEPH